MRVAFRIILVFLPFIFYCAITAAEDHVKDETSDHGINGTASTVTVIRTTTRKKRCRKPPLPGWIYFVFAFVAVLVAAVAIMAVNSYYKRRRKAAVPRGPWMSTGRQAALKKPQPTPSPKTVLKWSARASSGGLYEVVNPQEIFMTSQTKMEVFTPRSKRSGSSAESRSKRSGGSGGGSRSKRSGSAAASATSSS